MFIDLLELGLALVEITLASVGEIAAGCLMVNYPTNTFTATVLLKKYPLLKTQQRPAPGRQIPLSTTQNIELVKHFSKLLPKTVE